MSNSKKTVLVITGSRSDYASLRPLIRDLDESKKLSLRLLVTGTHTLKKYGYTIDQIKREGAHIAHVVPVSPCDSMAESLAKEIVGISQYCLKSRPDVVVVFGDRDEAFAGAVVGGHLGIPVAHINGGDKTGYVVDEYIRHAITKFSHLHFPITDRCGKRVLLLGEESWRTKVVGALGLDEMRSSPLVSKKEVAKKYGLDEDKPWFLIMYHPTPLDPLPLMEQARPFFKVVGDLQGEKIINYPNSDTGSDIFIKEMLKYKNRPGVHIFKNIPRNDFIAMLTHVSLLLGNSSAGIIESSYLHLPTVDVGNRQKMREYGINVVHSTYDERSIRSAVHTALTPAFRRRCKRAVSPYDKGGATRKIVNVLEKYVGQKDLFYKKLTYK